MGGCTSTAVDKDAKQGENFAQLLIIHILILGFFSIFNFVDSWSNLFSGTFWAPIYYCLMPWRTVEVYRKVYELIDEASIFPWPQNLEVMMDFEM